MGCAPSNHIVEDPEVDFYAQVGATAITALLGYRVLSNSCVGGILYVKNGELCLEAGCSASLYDAMFGTTWNLADIKEIRVVNDETVFVFSRRQMTISLNPGLKITVESSLWGTSTLLIEMPDAMNFAQRLRDHIGGDHPVPLINQI